MTMPALQFNDPPPERFGAWVQTFTGRAYWPADPHRKDVDLVDIAHALSMQCRYAGHSSEFYSVAEHSLIVSYMVPEEHALQALLHDATEAYLIDVPRPVKRLLKDYALYEHRNWLVIAQHFGLPFQLHKSVKQADTDILAFEKARLLGASPLDDWLGEPHVPVHTSLPEGVEITCDPPKVAKAAFLERFYQLTTQQPQR